jgi:hypothetical protein
MLEVGEDISSLEKNQLIYNPTKISLPTNLQTPQTHTYQPLNLYPKPHKPMFYLNDVISDCL